MVTLIDKTMEPLISEALYNAYFKSLLAGQRQTCSKIVQTLLNREIDIKTLYIDLFQKSLYEIGHLWETNKISVAREHLATAITEGLLNLVYPYLFSGTTGDQKIVVSCAPNEYHQIGGKMVADLFEFHGWDTHFVGANTPNDHLLSLIDEIKPRLVGLSLSIYFNMPLLHVSLEAIQTHYHHLDIIVGGQAFKWGGMNLLKRYPTVTYIPSLNAVERYLHDVFKKES